MEIPQLRDWGASATPEMSARLVALLKFKKSTKKHRFVLQFYQYFTGRRSFKAETAVKIAEAMQTVKSEFPDAPEPLSQRDLCATCARCPLFQDSK
jgi:hypothetical protein